jgi:hypothetical protein
LKAPGSFAGGIAAPPFARQAAAAAQAAAQPSARPPAGGQRVDPFGGNAGAAPVQSRKVTLVLDDSAIKDDEIGRKSRTLTMGLAVLGTVLGLGLGFGIGSTAGDRRQFSMAVHDGKDIYTKIQEVSKQVDAARTLLRRAVDASSGGPGKKASVDFPAIEELVAMKRPFGANEFHRKLYRAFDPGVVDDLFDYYNSINLMWDAFTTLGARTAGQGKRDALVKSAAATDGLLNTQYGMVLAKNGEAFAGSLVFVTIPPAVEPPPEPKKGKAAEPEAQKVLAASSQGGQGVERTLFAGQDGLSEDFDKYVFILDKVRSRTILGESANLFAKYRGDLMDINARMDKATETQGRLVTGLGKIASLSD